VANILDIYLGDRLIGAVVNTTNDQNFFEFDPAYAEDAQAPVLSQSFYDGEDNLFSTRRPVSGRVPAYFANLLPEGHLRQYAADQAGIHSKRDFPLLWLLGNDLPGAIIAKDHFGDGLPPRQDESINRTEEELDRNQSVIRFSLAGIQLKFSAVIETAGGLTIPAHGLRGDFILKLPSASYSNVPENEFSMMTFARDVGIDVPDIGLVNPEDIHGLPSKVRNDLGRAFYIKRFDRKPDGSRVHTEDFNQVYGQFPEQKYKNVSYTNMLADIREMMGDTGVVEFVRRLIFNIGIGNGDMHLKNWSLIYPDGRTPQFTPAYDYLSTIVYIEDDKLGLSIAGSKRWGDVSFDNLERFARKAGVPRGLVLQSAREMVAAMWEIWPKIPGKLPIDATYAKAISKHMNSIPIFNPALPTQAPIVLSEESIPVEIE